MFILGFNCYVFNSAACLVKDGDLIAAAQEERFTRTKNTGVFPYNAISYCLSEAGIKFGDLDHVGFHWKPFHQFHKRIALIMKYFPDSLLYYNTHSERWLNIVTVERELKKKFCADLNDKKSFSFHRVKHHLCHAASAFLCSPYDEAAILTLDGSGEMSSSSFWLGRGKDIKLLREIYYPHSLGYLYVSLTHYLGFEPDKDEYKVMGLASYGEPEYYDEFKKIITLTPEGGYRFDLSYFNYQRGIRDPWVSRKFIDIFGPVRKRNEPIEQRHQNIACSLQKRLEDAILHMALHLGKSTKQKNLCMAGGVALNSSANGRLLRESPFEHIFVQPAANDAGTGIGSAFYIYNCILGYPRKFVLKNIYLGPSYSDNDCVRALESSNLQYKRLQEDELTKEVAGLIAGGKIIGWFQGKMEIGQRALGNRSILADPRIPEIKDILNRKVKHREEFRPFAPSVIEESAGEFFENARPSPFMLCVFKVKEDKKAVIPGVTHVDGTARVQTVKSDENPLYWKLIKEFEKITGVPVILNTSFNVMGEPIVCSPQDAVKCFSSTEMDYLALGNYLAWKIK